MKKKNFITFVISIVGGILIWLILSIFLPINKSELLSLSYSIEFYVANRALFGVVLLTAADLLFSFLNDSRPQNKNLYLNLNYNVLHIIKLMLSFYILVYWYNRILYIWISGVNVILGIGFLFGIWPLLLFVNGIMSVIIIMFEPWQYLIQRLRLSIYGKYVNRLLVLGITRLLVLLLINLIYFWFASAEFPIEGNQLVISTSLFIVWGFATFRFDQHFRKKNSKFII